MNKAEQTKRFQFVKQCFYINPYMRFQNWQKSLKHNLFNKTLLVSWYKNEEFLRYSIEHEKLTELRLDLDLKNKYKKKDLMLNIKKGQEIYKKLKDYNIKSSLYYSAGSGIHIHALFCLSDVLQLKHNKVNIDCLEYEKEFRTKNKQGFNYSQIKKRSDERTELKKLICDFFDITKLTDNNLFSSIVMLTLEGSQKRDSITKNYKIYIDDKIMMKKTYQEIFKYVDDNKKEFIINENYFNEINEIKGDLLQFVNKKLQSTPKKHNTQGEPQNKEILKNKGSCISKTDIHDYKPTDKVKKSLIAFATLYKKKNLNSKTRFPYMVCKYLYSDIKNINICVYVYENIFNKICNIDYEGEIKDKLIIAKKQIEEKEQRTIFMFCDKKYPNNFLFDKKEWWDIYNILQVV
jgi:hypothetical protein